MTVGNISIQKLSHSSELNARERLSMIHRAYMRLQLAAGLALQVGDIHEARGRLSETELVNMLAAVRTRATMEMSIARALGDAVASRVDLLTDSHISTLFGSEMVRVVQARCAEVDALWGPTTDWPSSSTRVVDVPVPYIPRLTVWERFVLLFRGHL